MLPVSTTDNSSKTMALDHTSAVDSSQTSLESGTTGNRFQRFNEEIKHLFTTRDGLLGNYDYAWLLTPDIYPFNRKYADRVQPFYGINDRLPLLLILVLGLQHALAMIGGVVAVPLIVAGSGGANLPQKDISYLISAALILSGIFSTFQIMRLRIFKSRFFLGTGMLSVVGEAFAIVPIAQNYFAGEYAAGRCPSMGDVKQPCPEAYGKLIGTIACCMIFQIALSFIPPKILMRTFPPVVTGSVLLMIGGSLVSSGMKNWAGGSNACMNRPTTGFFQLCPNINAKHAELWGSPKLIGLGFSVFITILIVERFGSPIIRSASIICGLAVGSIIAGAAGYIDSSSIKSSPAITFLWTTTFPLGVDGRLVLPLLACCVTTLISCLGDIYATAEVSGLELEGKDIQERVQGGLTADGVWSVLAALCTSTPTVCFAQNNGVIALTGCGSRRAGYGCCFFLLLAGIIAKFGAAIVSLPNSVIGGVTTFLFTAICVSGLRILALVPWNRRNRFIATAALSIGIADLVVPTWPIYLLPDTNNSSLQGFYDGIELLLKTSYCIVAFIAVFLNLIMPEEKAEIKALEAPVLPIDETKQH